MITLVYGVVALIVKADDAGAALADDPRGLVRGFGRGLVRGMPVLLKGLSVLGTAAMLWVGGGIIVHGLEGYGWAGLGHGIHAAAEAVAHAIPAVAGALEWLVSAAAFGVVGLVVGAAIIPLVQHVAVPAMQKVRA